MQLNVPYSVHQLQRSKTVKRRCCVYKQRDVTIGLVIGVGTGGTKLLGEQVIHFFCTFLNILGNITYDGNRGDRGKHGNW